MFMIYAYRHQCARRVAKRVLFVPLNVSWLRKVESACQLMMSCWHTESWRLVWSAYRHRQLIRASQTEHILTLLWHTSSWTLCIQMGKKPIAVVDIRFVGQGLCESNILILVVWSPLCCKRHFYQYTVQNLRLVGKWKTELRKPNIHDDRMKGSVVARCALKHEFDTRTCSHCYCRKRLAVISRNLLVCHVDSLLIAIRFTVSCMLNCVLQLAWSWDPCNTHDRSSRFYLSLTSNVFCANRALLSQRPGFADMSVSSWRKLL